MSILLMAHAMDLEGLTPGQKSVLVALCNFSNDDGENVMPAHETIAKKTSLTRRTVVPTVKQLIDLGYVTITGRKAGNRQNIYQLDVNKIMQMCRDCTPNDPCCANIAHNPLKESLKDLKDKDIKDLKDSPHTEFAQQKAEQYGMMKALAATCSRVLADNLPILGRFAKSLLKLGYTPDDVTEFRRYWYTYDWRGKMKQPPSPAQVVELIGTSKAKAVSSKPTQDEIDQAMQEIRENEVSNENLIYNR